MNVTRRTALSLGSAGALALSLAACGGGSLGGGSSSGGDGGSSLKIGLLIPQTGAYAPLGEQMQQAADLFLKRNDNMVGGAEVELVVGDSAANPETGRTRAREMMLNDEVNVITGIVASPVASTVAEEAVSNEVPLLIANAGANEVTGPGTSEFVWRISQSNYQHGYAAGAYCAQHVSTSNGVYIGADYAAGTETYDGFIAGYQENGGGDLLAEILTPFGSTQNFQPFLSQIPDEAEFVYGFYAGGEAITFVQNYKDFGYTDRFPLIGCQNVTDEDIIDAVGDYAEGVVTVGLYSPELDNDANQEFVAAWEEEYGERPSIIACTTWDAFAFISAAVEASDGDVSGPALAAAFGEVGTLTSPRGDFELDPDTHNPIQAYYARRLAKEGDGYVNPVEETIPDVVQK